MAEEDKKEEQKTEKTKPDGKVTTPEAKKTYINTQQIVGGSGISKLTGLDLGAFTTDVAQQMRQKTFDPSKVINEVKVPSAGKPLNNNDPYPIDLKIEEIENHLPRVRQYQLKFQYEPAIAGAVLELSDYTEKRLVKLENCLATVMRYVFATGSRFAVNCVYYGGQDHRSKYQCIRCMKDSREGDGQVMQLDQCLSCSRYEPIIGQTYDILNELGVNLSEVQDDNQMGYMNMSDYLDFTRVERAHKTMEKTQLNSSTVKIRDANEKDFKQIWDKGIQMNWNLVPVESQKPQINWRPDINHEDRSPKKLASYQQANGLGASGLGCMAAGIAAGNYGKWMKKHYDNMMAASAGSILAQERDGDIANYNCADRVNTTIENMNAYGWKQSLVEQCTEAGLDPLIMFAITAVEAGGYPGAGATEGGCAGMFQSDSCPSSDPVAQITDAISKFCGKIELCGKGDNPIAPVQAYNGWGSEYNELNTENTLYDDAWIKMVKEDPVGSPKIRGQYFGTVMSCYILAQGTAGINSLDNNASEDSYTLPFSSDKNKDVFFIRKFGATNASSGGLSIISSSIVFKLPEGTELHAAFSGPVVATGESEELGGKYIKIKDTKGAMLTYGGIGSIEYDSQSLKSPAKGDIIATSGELLVLQYTDENGDIADPCIKYRMLDGKCSTEKSLGDQEVGNTVKNTGGTNYTISGGNGTYDWDKAYD